MQDKSKVIFNNEIDRKAYRKAINSKNFAESTVKEAAVEAAEDGSKTYQVVLTDKEGAESTVFFNEKGEILK